MRVNYFYRYIYIYNSKQVSSGMSCYEEIRNELVEALLSAKKVEELLRLAQERSRFGLFDVLKAYAVLASAPDFTPDFKPVRSRNHISRPHFMRILLEVFPPTDVDLWCMPLEENASSIAGQDAFLVKERTCALFLYGGFATFTESDTGMLDVGACAYLSSGNYMWNTMDSMADPEILLRTLPLVVLTRDLTHRISWSRVSECHLLQGGIFSKETLLNILSIVTRRKLDPSVIYQSNAMRVLFSEYPMSGEIAFHFTKALLSFRYNEVGTRSDFWISTYGDSLRDHSHSIALILKQGFEGTATHYWPEPTRELPRKWRTVIACLCVLLTPHDKREVADSLRSYRNRIAGLRRWSRDYIEMLVDHFIPEAIASCTVATKSAAT